MTNRRILTPISASVFAGLVVAVATLGGTFAGENAAPKADRFAVTQDTLCDGQEWPTITSECLAWIDGGVAEGQVRFVTLTNTDEEAGFTTLTRVLGDDLAPGEHGDIEAY